MKAQKKAVTFGQLLLRESPKVANQFRKQALLKRMLQLHPYSRAALLAYRLAVKVAPHFKNAQVPSEDFLLQDAIFREQKTFVKQGQPYIPALPPTYQPGIGWTLAADFGLPQPGHSLVSGAGITTGDGLQNFVYDLTDPDNFVIQLAHQAPQGWFGSYFREHDQNFPNFDFNRLWQLWSALSFPDMPPESSNPDVIGTPEIPGTPSIFFRTSEKNSILRTINPELIRPLEWMPEPAHIPYRMVPALRPNPWAVPQTQREVRYGTITLPDHDPFAMPLERMRPWVTPPVAFVLGASRPRLAFDMGLGHLKQPPALREKERKVKAIGTIGRALMGIYGQYTEVNDAIDAFYKGVHYSARPRYKNTWFVKKFPSQREKMETIYRVFNTDKYDVLKAIRAYVEAQAKDALIGLQADIKNKAFLALNPGSPVGAGFTGGQKPMQRISYDTFYKKQLAASRARAVKSNSRRKRYNKRKRK